MSDTLTSEATEAAAVPDYPMERAAGCPFAPPPRMLEMNETAPLSRVRIWDGSTPWLVTGYEAARALFADPRISVDDRISGFPHWNAHMLATVNKRPRSVFTSDAEEHTRFRRMLSKPFTFRRVETLRAVIQDVTDECIDEILAGPAPVDMIKKLALPVPTRVISDMLGVPYEDHEFFQEHANAGMARNAAADAMQKGAMSLHQYLINLVEKKQKEPAEDAVSDLAERVTAGEISVKEAAQLGTGLLQEVTRAGATAADLGRAAIAANDGKKPWLPHFYLGHGIGVNAAEMPMIGTDLGDEFDENYVLQAGMVLVLEPVIWEDGTGGYRSEEIVVITEEGWIKLTDYPYSPYGD
ncbi:M24 family metallopeptidase [Mycolicibacterium sphagni]|nr:M24 family metallopeptidase [Mycolicibacterium sphagni]